MMPDGMTNFISMLAEKNRTPEHGLGKHTVLPDNSLLAYT